MMHISEEVLKCGFSVTQTTLKTLYECSHDFPCESILAVENQSKKSGEKNQLGCRKSV